MNLLLLLTYLLLLSSALRRQYHSSHVTVTNYWQLLVYKAVGRSKPADSRLTMILT
ncbi:hypothetical protein [Paenibacillus planticolens]|uniref:hypothetical protein n=1 Tax=Paenibacillus planticolens TaxID=2654976 RepID=UPI001491DB95|nr:hypothetical protein [Paenibacillus planticolens]